MNTASNTAVGRSLVVAVVESLTATVPVSCVTTGRTAVGAVAATTDKTLPGVAAAVGLADIEK